MSKSISEMIHQINFSSQLSPVISTELVVPTSSHVESSSQLPQKRGSVVTSSYQHSRMSTSTSEVGHHIHFSSSLNAVMSTELVAPSSSHMKRRSLIPHQRSSTVSENQNLSPSLRSTVKASLDKSTLQTSSSAVSATPSRERRIHI
ncbi:hypothetical protein OS493_032271 [Desmophyllum pertusum]|uniref:Uncharacterized protein n=1 Tax=Desmophyllum pertusum TaxID=174260 RepID=A0A9W9ZB43_9CNID|nr:hypothetical protein OS493_032271 [Desmophyllum pertusum]